MANNILFLIYVPSMESVALTVFFACLGIIFYTYFGYPLLVWILINVKKLVLGARKPVKTNWFPPVTLVVAAYNEAEIIEEKIQNTLELDYPASNLAIIFITDGSTDNTPKIIGRYPQITLLHDPQRRGKLAAMNRTLPYIETEFVVFSDANTVLNRDCLKKMIPHFASFKVGGVSGEKKVAGQADGDKIGRSEGLYWRYESLLKRLDSDLYTIVGAAGELFAVRTALYTRLSEDTILDDFVQSLNLCMRGYVVRYEPGAFSTERASLTFAAERERKIRIAAGGFQAIGRLAPLLNVFRYPLVTFQYVSHRLFRWVLCPPALLLMLASAAILYIQRQTPLHSLLLVSQALFYSAGLLGWYRLSRDERPGALQLPFYFMFMHYCILAGYWRYLGKKQPAAWLKAERGEKYK